MTSFSLGENNKTTWIITKLHLLTFCTIVRHRNKGEVADFTQDTCADQFDFDGENVVKIVNRNQLYRTDKSGTMFFFRNTVYTEVSSTGAQSIACHQLRRGPSVWCMYAYVEPRVLYIEVVKNMCDSDNGREDAWMINAAKFPCVRACASETHTGCHRSTFCTHAHRTHRVPARPT